MAEPTEAGAFENLSLDNDDKVASENVEHVEEHPEADKLADSMEDSAVPATLSDGSGDQAASVERSMEQTVDLPLSHTALVSLSPVDERDLVVIVDDPRVINPASSYTGPYVTYSVTTRTTRQTFDRSDYCVRRRYQDFVWLREQLADVYRTHIVPPLPEKHSLSRLVQNDHFTPEFLERRQAALQKFLGRCTEHPTMSFDRTLMAFLIASDQELASAKSRGAGLMSKVSATVWQAASGILLKNPDPEFAALQAYFTSLGKHLAEIESSASQALQDGQELTTVLNTLQDICQRWAAIEKDDKAMLAELATCFRATSDTTAALCKDLSPAFAPFHEYSLFCESAQAVLKRREAQQMDYELSVEELLAKQTALEEAKGADMSKSLMAFFSNPEKLKAEKIQQAEDSHVKAQTASERANDDLECANEHLRADMARWQRVKKSDIAKSFVNVADVHISHLQTSLETWQGMLDSLESAEARSSGGASA